MILTIALLLVAAPGAFADGKDGWMTDLYESVKQAGKKGRLILLFVSDGTANSRKMLAILERNAVVAALLAKSFVRVKAKKGDDLAEIKMLAPRRYPSTIVLTPTRRPVRQIDGVVSAQKVAEQLRIALSQFEKLKTGTGNFLPEQKVPSPHFPVPGPRSSDQPPRNVREYPHTRTCPTMCPVCEAMRSKALAYLARVQRPDGCYRRKERIDEKNAEALDFVDVSLTSLALIAFRSEGSTTRAGKYSDNVRRALDWIAKTARPSGEFCQKDTDEILYQIYTNWHTAFAAWAIVESQGTEKSPEHRDLLARAARYLEKQQDPRDGGWGYGKFWKTFERKTSWGFVNVGANHLILTVLRLMEKEGVKPSAQVLQRGEKFLKGCRGRFGGYGYDPAKRAFEYPGSTGGALVTWCVAGRPPDDAWHRSHRFLRYQLPVLESFKRDECLNFFHLFAALAVDLCHPEDYRDYWRLYRDRFVSEQNDDGSWDSPIAGKAYATAIRLIVMNLPRRNLRIQGFRAARPPARKYHEAKPAYLRSRKNLTQQKVFKLKKRFAPWEKYGIDLVVRVDDAHKPGQEEMFRRVFEGAADLLYDLTDGQFRVNSVELTWKPVKKPDVLITRDTHFDIHGIARTMRKVVNGRETAVVERDVVLPLDSPVWKGPAGAGVVAHELSHYFFGMPDEYAQDTRRPYCPGCIMAGSWHGWSEYCTKRTHADKRNPLSCWELMKAAYPLVDVPTTADPGPHLCPPPLIVIVP